MLVGVACRGAPSSADTATVNIGPAANYLATPAIAAATLTANGPAGSIGINIGGTGIESGVYKLIGHSGPIGGTGFSAFTLGAVVPPLGPHGAPYQLLDNAGSLDLKVVNDSLIWSGAQSNQWKTGSIPPAENWKLSSDNSPTDYREAAVSDKVVFDDSATAAHAAVEISAANVAPLSVTFNNTTAVPYTLNNSGSGFGITGSASLVKNNSGTVNLLNANSYSGGTTISGGRLSFAAGALGSAGAIAMNGGALRWHGANTEDISGRLALIAGKTATLDVTAGNNVTLATALGGSATGALNKTGDGTLTLAALQTYTGVTSVSGGKLQLGTYAQAAILPAANAIDIAAGAELVLAQDSGTTAMAFANPLTGTGTWTLTGTGTSLHGQYTVTGTKSGFTGTVNVENGARHNAGNSTAYVPGDGGTINVKSGGQLWFASMTVNLPINIVGAGWSETSGLFGAVRFGGGTWSGPIALTGDARIGAHASTGTITGNITGAYELELACGGTSAGTLTLVPAAGSNTYLKTRIGANTTIVAGNANALSTGLFTMDGGTLKLNGNSLGFANLRSTLSNGNVQNGGTAAATLTVGSDGANSTYAGTLTNGSTGALALTKTGAGILTLSGANTYTGDTTVGNGTLQVGTSGSVPSGSNIVLNGGRRKRLGFLCRHHCRQQQRRNRHLGPRQGRCRLANPCRGEHLYRRHECPDRQIVRQRLVGKRCGRFRRRHAGRSGSGQRHGHRECRRPVRGRPGGYGYADRRQPHPRQLGTRKSQFRLHALELLRRHHRRAGRRRDRELDRQSRSGAGPGLRHASQCFLARPWHLQADQVRYAGRTGVQFLRSRHRASHRPRHADAGE
jgi:autotransporter-associated beta strand protein